MPKWQMNLDILFLAELVSSVGFSVVVPFLSLYVNEKDASFGNTEFWAGVVYSATAPRWLPNN